MFAPVSQALISAFGWVSALWTLAAACLATIPLACKLGNKPHAVPMAGALAEITLKEQIRVAFQDRSYQWMWYADIALASLAAVVNLPIREAHPQVVAA